MNENTLHGRLTARGNMTGTVNTIVYAHNYNDLSNKPSINSITLQGNKTASDLGLATPSDILVTSVNEQTGDVELTGDNIPYDTLTSVNAKINDLESQIVGAGVQSVNGMTGNVTLTGANINYSVGVSLNARIDAVEGEIPVINYPVTSVNSKTGAVVLDGSDIAYDSENTINEKINAVEGEIPVIDYPVTSVNEQTGDVSLTDNDISHYTGTPTAGTTAEAIASKAEIKYIELSGTTNPNGLLSFDRNKKIVSAICTTANYVLFQIQDYVIVKHYNTFAIITGEAVKFDVYYYEP